MRMKWVGHVAAWETRKTHAIFVGKPERKMSLGRTWLR
jgi:hypothetical protein